MRRGRRPPAVLSLRDTHLPPLRGSAPQRPVFSFALVCLFIHAASLHTRLILTAGVTTAAAVIAVAIDVDGLFFTDRLNIIGPGYA